MPIVRIEHSVPDFVQCKRVFDGDPADRKGSGVRTYQILRLRDDPNMVLIDLEFESLDEADAFLRKMERLWEGPGKAVMQSPSGRVAECVERKTL